MQVYCHYLRQLMLVSLSSGLLLRVGDRDVSCQTAWYQPSEQRVGLFGLTTNSASIAAPKPKMQNSISDVS